jgi:hypothetical protein
MEREELFAKSVSILVQAYQNDTLIAGDCAACAVGNLIMGNNCDLKLVVKEKVNNWWTIYNWAVNGEQLHKSVKHQWMWKISGIPQLFPEYDEVVAQQQIDSTGYTLAELQRIEHAFEHCRPSTEDAMFERLEAVYNVLCSIHGGVDMTKASEVFVKAPVIVEEKKEEVALVA